MRKLLIGAAALAFAAGSAHANPGHGGGGGDHGGGGGHGNGRAAMAGGGGQDVGHGKGRENGHGGPSGSSHGNAEHGNAGAREHGNSGAWKHGNGGARERGNPEIGHARSGHAMRGEYRPAMKPDRGASARPTHASDMAHRSVRARETRGDLPIERVRNVERGQPQHVAIARSNEPSVSWAPQRRGVIEGCPPGLAKKNNGCMPPGLARQRDEAYRQSYYRPQWFGYDNLGDGRYYYDDGYLYRTGSGGSILGYVPLLGGALSVGNPWPTYYQPMSVPEYYVNYYNLGPANGYRYADDVLYRVDPNTSAITSIAALLTGDRFTVGQPMPAGYDIYNVPYGYQDRYVDGPDSYYRYADGYVYQVDPTTQLIQAAIQLLT